MLRPIAMQMSKRLAQLALCVGVCVCICVCVCVCVTYSANTHISRKTKWPFPQGYQSRVSNHLYNISSVLQAI